MPHVVACAGNMATVTVYHQPSPPTSPRPGRRGPAALDAVSDGRCDELSKRAVCVRLVEGRYQGDLEAEVRAYPAATQYHVEVLRGAQRVAHRPGNVTVVPRATNPAPPPRLGGGYTRRPLDDQVHMTIDMLAAAHDATTIIDGAAGTTDDTYLTYITVVPFMDIVVGAVDLEEVDERMRDVEERLRCPVVWTMSRKNIKEVAARLVVPYDLGTSTRDDVLMGFEAHMKQNYRTVAWKNHDPSASWIVHHLFGRVPCAARPPAQRLVMVPLPCSVVYAAFVNADEAREHGVKLDVHADYVTLQIPGACTGHPPLCVALVTKGAVPEKHWSTLWPPVVFEALPSGIARIGSEITATLDALAAGNGCDTAAVLWATSMSTPSYDVGAGNTSLGDVIKDAMSTVVKPAIDAYIHARAPAVLRAPPQGPPQLSRCESTCAP